MQKIKPPKPDRALSPVAHCLPFGVSSLGVFPKSVCYISGHY